jgi:probable phosphoglycerate mutase
MSRTVYIVRHGNTFNKGDTVTRVGAKTDLSLSQSGQAQAHALAAHFAQQDIAFSRAIAGPLKRTRETAAIMLAAHAQAPELEIGNFLREIDYGPDENMPEAEVIARIGEAALEAWETDATPPPGWRVDAAAIEGQWDALFSKLARSDEAGPVLIVTSNGIARFALRLARRQTSEAAPTLKLKTGAYGIMRIGDHPPALIDWNLRP